MSHGSGFLTGATPTDLAALKADEAADPDFGTQAQADVRYNAPPAVQQRKDALAEALAKATAAPKVTAEGNLAVENAKNKGAIDLANTRSSNQLDLMNEFGASGGSPTQGMVPSIGPQGVTFKPAQVPQTVQAERHSAEVGLSMIPELRTRLADLVTKGAIGGGALSGLKQRAGSAAVAGGYDTLADTFGLLPAGARELNDFKTRLTLTKSNLGKVHFGNRASAAIGAKFDELLNPNQSPEALAGGLDATEAWLRKYANVNTPPEVAMDLPGQ